MLETKVFDDLNVFGENQTLPPDLDLNFMPEPEPKGCFPYLMKRLRRGREDASVEGAPPKGLVRAPPSRKEQQLAQLEQQTAAKSSSSSSAAKKDKGAAAVASAKKKNSDEDQQPSSKTGGSGSTEKLQSKDVTKDTETLDKVEVLPS